MALSVLVAVMRTTYATARQGSGLNKFVGGPYCRYQRATWLIFLTRAAGGKSLALSGTNAWSTSPMPARLFLHPAITTSRAPVWKRLRSRRRVARDWVAPAEYLRVHDTVVEAGSTLARAVVVSMKKYVRPGDND